MSNIPNGREESELDDISQHSINMNGKSENEGDEDERRKVNDWSWARSLNIPDGREERELDEMSQIKMERKNRISKEKLFKMLKIVKKV